jgi:hypothetical protein
MSKPNQLVMKTVTIELLNGRHVELPVLRSQISHRGGGFEVDLMLAGWPQVRMTAYQNYLGGGLIGRIQNSCTISDWNADADLANIARQLRAVMHSLTNPDPDEQPWESQTFEQVQRMPVSAY